jgi:hypothetical protein
MTQGRITRRRFIAEGPRLALAGVITAVTGVLIARRRGPMNEQPCIGAGACRGCGVLANCGLPRALSAKAAGIPGGRT